MKISFGYTVISILLVIVLYLVQESSGATCAVNFVTYQQLVTLVTGNLGPSGAMKKKKKKNETPEGMVTFDRQQSLFVYNWFNCTGNLTRLTFGAHWNGLKTLYPEFQLWRASTSNSYIYNKVATYTPDTITGSSANKMYTVDLNPPLEVLSGDTLGIYQPEKPKSTLVLYLYEHTQDYHYYFKDRMNEAMSSIDTTELKMKQQYPMVTAVIESSSIAIDSSSTVITSSSTTDSTIISFTTTSLSTHYTTTIQKTTSAISTTSSSFPLRPSPSTSLTKFSQLHTTPTPSIETSIGTSNLRIIPTHLSKETTVLLTGISTTPISLDKTSNIVTLATISSIQTTLIQSTSIPIRSSYSVNTESSSLAEPTTLLNGTISSSIFDDKHITPMIAIIIGSAIGMTGIVLGIVISTVCLIAVFVKRKKRQSLRVPPGITPCRRTNRYIQKTVCSPMYEGVEKGPSRLLRTNIPLHTIHNIHNSFSSTNSSISVSIYPEVSVTPAASESINCEVIKRDESPVVSPYEKPVVAESHYELSDELYVPDEEQRLSIFGNNCDAKGYEFDEKLYKSLYEVQHSNDSDSIRKPCFEESKKYWKPKSSSSAIYRQLASKRFREIPRHNIEVIQHLGAGQFATVNKAKWKSSGGEVEVAVKMLKTGASEQEKVKFLQEAAINGQFHHLNVVRLLGVVTVGEPAIIILELLRNGNLKKFLSTKRPLKGYQVSNEVPGMLLNFCKQVSAGMEYLSKKTFIHRDLAARNILVSDQLICKVADFGMSRDLEESSYYISQGGLVPIKWTAPEAIYYRKYSVASDVWSYGVLMFEIWTLGKKPFASITNEQYIERIDEGERLTPPPGCPRLIYQLMMDCWHPEADERPSFTSIMQYLSQCKELLLQSGVSNEEINDSPDSILLGGPLEDGQGLFKDLQIKYLE